MSLSIFAAAQAAPQREGLVCDGARLTFSALAQRVRARSGQFRALGIRPLQPRPVALVVDGSLTMFECLHLCLELGVPILPLHPRLTRAEREHLLSASLAHCVIDPSTLEPAPQTPDRGWHFALVPEEQPLAYVPSSGSTGRPKLVELSRRAFLALCRADSERVPPRPDDRALLCLPLSHVGGLSLVLRALSQRRCCVAFRAHSGGLLASASQLAECLIEEKISLLSLVPAVLARLLREAPEIATQAPLRAILLGGQACSAELFSAARERAFPVLTSYGLTEACSQVSTLAFPPPVMPPLKQGVVGVGFPLPGVEIRLVDGVIQVRGPSLFSGYLGQSPPFESDGFFKTGDRGEFDPELGLFVFGRESELIISGGENVDPSEVEHALLACEGVEAALVFGVPDPEFGERVAAALELRAGATWDEHASFAALDQRLASYKQPRAVCFFDALPRLPSGKLDRTQIRGLAAQRLRPVMRGPRAKI
ncbi:MAG TPA: AMP-binding protein [Polyangiaceae bacterium]|nr:AMP-binding protein [Polyangiaceae bacterium]